MQFTQKYISLKSIILFIIGIYKKMSVQ